jgi:hypothetical protein
LLLAVVVQLFASKDANRSFFFLVTDGEKSLVWLVLCELEGKIYYLWIIKIEIQKLT